MRSWTRIPSSRLPALRCLPSFFWFIFFALRRSGFKCVTYKTAGVDWWSSLCIYYNTCLLGVGVIFVWHLYTYSIELCMFAIFFRSISGKFNELVRPAVDSKKVCIVHNRWWSILARMKSSKSWRAPWRYVCIFAYLLMHILLADSIWIYIYTVFSKWALVKQVPEISVCSCFFGDWTLCMWRN